MSTPTADLSDTVGVVTNSIKVIEYLFSEIGEEPDFGLASI